MARQSPLVIVRNMVKTHRGLSLALTSNAQDAEINQIIMDVEQWSASEYDWPFLRSRWDVTVGAGVRYLPVPTVDDVGLTAAINFERAGDLKTFVKWNQVWQDVDYGITEEAEFNYIDSDRNQVLDPIQRWEFDDEMKFEVWPIPASTAQFRFVGQRCITDLRAFQTSGMLVTGNAYIIQTYVTGDNFTNVGGTNTNGSSFVASGTTPTTWTNGSALLNYPITWNDSALVDLDDLMTSYFAAAEYSMRSKQQQIAEDLLALGKARMAMIRATYPKRDKPPTLIGGGTTFDRRTLRIVPMIVVGGK